MLNVKLRSAVYILLLVPAAGMAGSIVVVPNANTSSAGNTLFAFGSAGNPVPTIFQESFDPGQFTGPIDITEISFRPAPAAVTTPVAGHAAETDASFGDLSVFLSTSTNYPNSTSGPLMSTTFANNTGPDNTLVFSGTSVTLSEAICAGSGPCPFGMNIDFTTPFVYNPADGSLLFEFVSSDASIAGFGQGYGYLDGEIFGAPGSIGAVFEQGSATATTGAFADGGLIAQFTFTAVAPAPEPTSWTMMAASAVGLLWMSRRRRSGTRGPAD